MFAAYSRSGGSVEMHQNAAKKFLRVCGVMLRVCSYALQ
jgi:hypothetical protein